MSGGQLQRISLARALYHSPRLLVLDEPNAHLDQAGEAALLNTINMLRRNKVTVIAITQHGKLLQSADKIVTIENGSRTSLHINRPLVPTAGNAEHSQPGGRVPLNRLKAFATQQVSA